MHSLLHRRAAAFAVGGVAVTVGAAMHRSPRAVGDASQQRIKLSSPVIDAVCGAAGEIAQICILYPLETGANFAYRWKEQVRCQAESIGADKVMAHLLRQGLGRSTLNQLYSGFGSAALFSMLVGAVHWLSFCAAKRAAMRALVPVAPAPVAAADPVASTNGRTEEVPCSGSVQKQKCMAYDLRATKAADGLGPPLQDAAPMPAPCNQGAKAKQLSAKTVANAFASLAGALATALVESPVELFRHQAQAGLIGGNLMREMGSAVRSRGPLALYFGFLPYCLESFPYDISELGTYSQLRDVYADCSRPSHPLAPVLARHLPLAAADLAIGAAAGAAAVLISMPFDCIKTYIQTSCGTHAVAGGPATAAQQGLLGGVRDFALTGAGMVARKGPGALFVGVVPRLLQQVPSSTICWWTVAACHKALQPYMDEEAAAAAANDSSGAGH